MYCKVILYMYLPTSQRHHFIISPYLQFLRINSTPASMASRLAIYTEMEIMLSASKWNYLLITF
jgi:hypothetical protein